MKKWTRAEDSTLKRFIDGEIDFPTAQEQLIGRSDGEIEARVAYLSLLFSGKDLHRY